jgi:chemotaxis protein histidine kinase CheA
MVQDADIPPEFRDVFIEESEEMVLELGRLTTDWLQDTENKDVLRDIRRHFHTFKGNGRAVGANILGELGWAAQDMLDRSLDGDLAPGTGVQTLVNEVVCALPDLVRSYSESTGPDVGRIRQLTSACFALAASGDGEHGVMLPEITDVISANGGAADKLTATKTLAH